MADPILHMKVRQKTLPFLVDTGARFSTLTGDIDSMDVSSATVEVCDFSGTSECLPLTRPLTTSVSGQRLHHAFIVVPRCPIKLSLLSGWCDCAVPQRKVL